MRFGLRSRQRQDEEEMLPRGGKSLRFTQRRRREEAMSVPQAQEEVHPPVGTTLITPMADGLGVMVTAVVPENVSAQGEFLTTLTNDMQVHVRAPPDGKAGDLVRVHLKPKMMDYDGHWKRHLNLETMEFKWARSQNGAFVRQLERLSSPSQHSNTPRGSVRLVPVEQGTVTTLVSSREATDPKAAPKNHIVTWEDLTEVMEKGTMEFKTSWFQGVCKLRLRLSWTRGHFNMRLRRQHNLLGDSMNMIMGMSPRDMRKPWKITFMDECGIDEGGLMRDWFHTVTKQLFDPSRGLWQATATNQTYMDVNPASGSCTKENHLLYFRFMGRMMGRALFDSQLIAGRMAKYLYKHILGFPITIEDLKDVDEVYYNSLMQLENMAREGTDISVLCQDFTTTRDFMGSKQIVELVEGGNNIPVTNDNVHEYIEACLKHRLFDGIKPQLEELLLGFYDVIPEAMMTIFGCEELELLMCGRPKIDMDDWMFNTKYTGEFEGIGIFHSTCEWFWEILKDDFDEEMRARTLLFVTGSSGSPARGFSSLRSNEGRTRRFTIHGVPGGVYLYPRAHTCFNQIDLPVFENKEALRERLTEAVMTGSGSFTLV